MLHFWGRVTVKDGDLCFYDDFPESVWHHCSVTANGVFTLEGSALCVMHSSQCRKKEKVFYLFSCRRTIDAKALQSLGPAVSPHPCSSRPVSNPHYHHHSGTGSLLSTDGPEVALRVPLSPSPDAQTDTKAETRTNTSNRSQLIFQQLQRLLSEFMTIGEMCFSPFTRLLPAQGHSSMIAHGAQTDGSLWNLLTGNTIACLLYVSRHWSSTFSSFTL